MKILLSGLILIFITNHSFAFQGIDFVDATFDEAKKMAKEENKMIFVDFYADWCGPCKWMDKNVYPNSKIGKGYNYHFISIKVDVDSAESELVERVRIIAIPTYGFFTSNGELIIKQTGSIDLKDFWEMGKMVVTEKRELLSKR